MATPPKVTPPSVEHVDEKFEELHRAVEAAASKAAAAAAKAESVRVDLGKKLDEVAATVSKLASARLLQQAFTSIVLAGALSILVKVVGG